MKFKLWIKDISFALGDMHNQIWDTFLDYFNLVKCGSEITQIGLLCEGNFAPESWSGDKLPTIEGETRVYQSFKPRKVIATETITVHYRKNVKIELPVNSKRKKVAFKTETKTAQRCAVVDNVSDVILLQAYSGPVNCFPNAPREKFGISGSAFSAKAIGNQIDWPVIHAGCDLSAKFAIERSVIYQIIPPDGFTYDDIDSVDVSVRLAFFGPVIRK